MAEVGGSLLEREDVTASTRRLIRVVAAGGSTALFVLGEAGLGKTSLFEQASRLADAAGLAVGLGRGHPMETSLPFGVLGQALTEMGGQGLLGEDGPGPTSPGDRAALFYRLLRWLQDKTDRGLVLALDDLHWADADSVALLSFVYRRIGRLPLGLVATLRPWPPGAQEAVAGLVHEGHGRLHRLAPLSEEAAGSLLQGRLGRSLPAVIRRRAFELCAGNPLLLEQLAVGISEGAAVPEAFQAGMAAFSQGVLLARFAGVPPAAMRCAQAASVLGTSFLPEVAAQLAGLQEGEADIALEALSRAGLIGQEPGAEAGFMHPLFCQALYNDLAEPIRARLHARAFAALQGRGMEAQAAEHAVRAHLVGDQEAVAVLERAGRAARRVGALATAVTRFGQAVVIAGDQASVGLLLARAEALVVAGQPGQAVSAYRQLLSRPAISVSAKVEALWMLGRALVMTGDHDRAAAVFDQAAGIARTGDPCTAVRVLIDASFSAVITGGPQRALPIAGQARDLASSLDAELRAQADAAWGEIAIQAGDPAGITAVEAAAPWLRPGQARGLGGQVVDPGARGSVNSYAFAAALVERLTEAERAFAALEASADRVSMPEDIAVLAFGHGYVLTRMGRLDEALQAINAALSLADLAPSIESFAAAGRACIQLYRGQLDDSAQWCQQAEARATDRGEWNALLILWDVLGHRRLREGAAAEACEYYARLEATVVRMGIGEPCLPPWPRHGISAYLANGRIADAERVLAWVDQASQRLPCRYPKIVAAVGRAQLAELRGQHDQAEAHYRAALALHGQVDLPLEHAETLLGYGAFLRRSGRPLLARPLLAQAAGIADATGARWLAGLARQELKVAGGRLRRHAAPGALSAQEERVAALAATGASNADIACQLCLSVSTVETHLGRIYAKLGIHNRYQLIAMAADASWGRKPAESSAIPPLTRSLRPQRNQAPTTPRTWQHEMAAHGMR